MQYCPNCRKLTNTTQKFYKDKTKKTVQEMICSVCCQTLTLIKLSLLEDEK